MSSSTNYWQERQMALAPTTAAPSWYQQLLHQAPMPKYVTYVTAGLRVVTYVTHVTYVTAKPRDTTETAPSQLPDSPHPQHW